MPVDVASFFFGTAATFRCRIEPVGEDMVNKLTDTCAQEGRSATAVHRTMGVSRSELRCNALKTGV